MSPRRLQRSIRLLQLLHDQAGISLSEIACSLGCSHRTIHRDLQILKENGYEILRCDLGYQLAEPFDLPKVAMDPAELLVLLVSLKASSLRLGELGERLTQGALRKILSCCSASTQERWLRLARAVRVAPNAAPLNGDDACRLQLLAAALDQGHAVQIQLASDADQRAIAPLLLPTSILGSPECWLVQGEDKDSHRPLTIPLSQIQIPSGHRSSSVPAPHVGSMEPKRKRSIDSSPDS